MGPRDTDPDVDEVTPLEHTAFFDIDTRRGYVRIDQSRGDQTLYTPAEARDIAETIVDAADEAAASVDCGDTDDPGG